jgi:two-component system response regulator HydG
MLRDFEARYVEHMLAAQGGVVTKAAAASGLARRYFQILKSRTR